MIRVHIKLCVLMMRVDVKLYVCKDVSENTECDAGKTVQSCSLYFSTHNIRVVKFETGEIKGSYFLNRRIKNAYMVIFRPENISRTVLFSTWKRWRGQSRTCVNWISMA